MAKVPNAVEILQKIWTAWVGRTSVTDDRQTDRQTDRETTDGRAIAYSEREREFTFAKNGTCRDWCDRYDHELTEANLSELSRSKQLPKILASDVYHHLVQWQKDATPKNRQHDRIYGSAVKKDVAAKWLLVIRCWSELTDGVSQL